MIFGRIDAGHARRSGMKGWIAGSLLGLVACCNTAWAEEGWVDMQGRPIPPSESANSVGGFSAAVMMTTDADWEAKWNTPPETVPSFHTANEVSPHGELYILTFVSNPQVDPATGKTDVVCDVVMHRPDGTVSASAVDQPCLQGELRGDPRNVYLTGVSMKYMEEPADARGVWSFSVVAKDRVRGVAVPLRASFLVKGQMPRRRPSAADGQGAASPAQNR